MDADDQLEQENTPVPEKKSHQPSGIEIDALHGLLDIYSTTDMKVRPCLFTGHENAFYTIECSSLNSRISASSAATAE